MSIMRQQCRSERECPCGGPPHVRTDCPYYGDEPDIKEQAVSDAVIDAGVEAYIDTPDFLDDAALVEAIYLAMQAASHPLEQQQAVSGGVVERMAKAIFFRGLPVDESIWQLLDPLTIKAYRQQAQAALTASGVGRMRSAAQALIDDVRRRYPGEELRCPLMIELDTALQDNDGGMEGG